MTCCTMPTFAQGAISETEDEIESYGGEDALYSYEDCSFFMYREGSGAVYAGSTEELYIDYEGYNPNEFEWAITSNHDEDTCLEISDDNTSAILHVSATESNTKLYIDAWSNENPDDGDWCVISVITNDDDYDDDDYDDDDTTYSLYMYSDYDIAEPGDSIELYLEYEGYDPNKFVWDITSDHDVETRLVVSDDNTSATLCVSEDEDELRLCVEAWSTENPDDGDMCYITVNDDESAQPKIIITLEAERDALTDLIVPAHSGEEFVITASCEDEDVQLTNLIWTIGDGYTSEDTYITATEGSASAILHIGEDETADYLRVYAVDSENDATGEITVPIMKKDFTGFSGDYYYENGEKSNKSGLVRYSANGYEHVRYIISGFDPMVYSFSGYSTFVDDTSDNPTKYYVGTMTMVYDESGNYIGTDMIDYNYTGFATAIDLYGEHGSGEGPEIYFVNGVEYRKTGLVQNADGEYVTIKDGVLSEDVTGLVQKLDGSDSTWYYVENGKLSTATGLSQKADGSTKTWLYVENGVYTKKTGLAKKLNSSDTNWYYVYKGNVRTASYYESNGLSNTGLAQKADGSTTTWLYVENGVYTKSTGLAQKLNSSDTNWYYVYKGNVRTASYYEKNGLKDDGLVRKIDTSSDSKWYYMKDGVYTKATGLAQKADGSTTTWLYVQDGVYTKATGLAQKVDGSTTTWLYVKNGVYTKSTGLARKIDTSSDTKWYYVYKGNVRTASYLTKNGLDNSGFTQKIDNTTDTKWYYVSNGVFKKSTGLAQKMNSTDTKWYYAKSGVYTKSTLTAKRISDPNGASYQVVKGIATSLIP